MTKIFIAAALTLLTHTATASTCVNLSGQWLEQTNSTISHTVIIKQSACESMTWTNNYTFEDGEVVGYTYTEPTNWTWTFFGSEGNFSRKNRNRFDGSNTYFVESQMIDSVTGETLSTSTHSYSLDERNTLVEIYRLYSKGDGTFTEFTKTYSHQ